MFSKACEYGIRAMIHIAHQTQKGNRVSLKEIAEEIGSPVAFTAKILQLLAKNELVISIKGSGGGYELMNEQSSTITLHKIVSSIDGESIFNKCGLGLEDCNETKPCPAHFQYKLIRDDLEHMTHTTTIIDMATKYKKGNAFLKT